MGDRNETQKRHLDNFSGYTLSVEASMCNTVENREGVPHHTLISRLELKERKRTEQVQMSERQIGIYLLVLLSSPRKIEGKDEKIEDARITKKEGLQ